MVRVRVEKSVGRELKNSSASRVGRDRKKI